MDACAERWSHHDTGVSNGKAKRLLAIFNDVHRIAFARESMSCGFNGMFDTIEAYLEGLA
jgi:hypothetical protein